MKTKTLFAILLILLTSFGCQEVQMEELETTSNSDLQVLAADNFGEYTNGPAHVVTTEGNEVVVIMENRLYVTYRRESSNMKIEFSSDNVSVINYRTSFLVFNHETQKGFFMYIDQDDRFGRLPESLSSKVERIDAYGLGQNDGLFKKYFEDPSIVKASTLYGSGDATSNGKLEKRCRAGGEGATSCSIGGEDDGCSVTCEDGYYACCNDSILSEATCTCY